MSKVSSDMGVGCFIETLPNIVSLLPFCALGGAARLAFIAVSRWFSASSSRVVLSVFWALAAVREVKRRRTGWPMALCKDFSAVWVCASKSSWQPFSRVTVKVSPFNSPVAPASSPRAGAKALPISLRSSSTNTAGSRSPESATWVSVEMVGMGWSICTAPP